MRWRWLLGVLLLGATAASADPTLLGVCTVLQEARCTSATEWSVSKTTSTPSLDNPVDAPAKFQVVVTEGATRHWITANAALTLTGLIPTGTSVQAIVVSIERYDPTLQGWSNVVSAAAGEPSAACECPMVQSGDLTLRVWDAAGNSLPSVPGVVLGDLPFGEQAYVSLDARYDLAAGIVSAQDQLRVSTCISYRQNGVSWQPGCFLDGGGILNVKACNDMDPGACGSEQQTIYATEELGALDAPIASLSGFAATSSSPYVTPTGVRALTAGGAALEYVVTASGVEGTQSVIDVEGTVSCNGTCTDPNGCNATFTNTATLTPSETWPDALDTPVNGSPARATVDVTCAGGSPPIAVGDFCSFTQGGWGARCEGNNPGCLLAANFDAIFGTPATCAASGGLTVGLSPPRQLRFTSAMAITDYLPAGGPPRALTTGPLCDPVKTSAGVFGGQVTALRLNVSSSDAGVLPQQSTTPLGDLIFAGGACAGLTVREVLARAEAALSGASLMGPCSDIADLNGAADAVNNNFDGCTTNLGALVLP